VKHRLQARAARPAVEPRIERDPDVIRGFLDDAAHVPGGHAAGVVFPRNEAEVAAFLGRAHRVLPVGAQSSLTGGATPRGEIVLSTRALTSIESAGGDLLRVGAGVPLKALQQTLARDGRFYPPVPTYDGAFVGGTIATNAAGAATFKYGSTRTWVEALVIVLADGSVVDMRRGDAAAHPDGWFEIESIDGTLTRVVLPTYSLPRVPKHSAGYYAAPGMDPIDLLIGSEGTLGVIVEATLRVITRSRVSIALVPCDSDAHAIAVTAALRESADLDVAGIEYMDDASLRLVGHHSVPALLVIQAEGDVDGLAAALERHGITDAEIALPGDHRAAERIFELRESVPATVNRHVAEARMRIHPDIEKTAADMIVPFDRLADSLAMYRRVFSRFGLEHAIWGHFSDGNLHPNVIPRSLDDVIRGREAILEIGREIIAMGGSPLAEHGVGRSAVKQQLLRQLYGEAGIDEMRAVKRALDPEWKLAPGVLFPDANDRDG
jgi:D-lactate dehydrogenase (cytochrome)